MRFRLFLIVALAGLVFLSGCAGFKQAVFNQGLSVERWRSSLTEKKVQVDDLSVSYLEREGPGETVVLLHGFSADKDNWVRFTRYLPRQYRVIAVDLPGHGSTTSDWTTTYSIEYMTKGFAATVDALHLERFHLAGNSMGGYVSTLYSAAHPERVATLCLLDSAGIAKPPQPSDREIALSHGINPLVPRTREDFSETLKYVFYKQPFLPWPALDVMGARQLARGPFNEKVWGDYHSHWVDVTGIMKEIRMPVLIMWGDRDRVTHISSMSVFQQGIPQARTVVFKDCGHMPMVEIPKESASVYASFLEGLEGKEPAAQPKASD
jgi:abhydrolase domain-containing protein 6